MAGKQPTFRRWERDNAMGCTATDTSRGHAAVTHLPKVSRNDGKTAHLPKVRRYGENAKPRYNSSEGIRKQTGEIPPSEGEWKWPESSPPSEGGKGTMRWDVRPQTPLEGMLQLLTFRR